MTFQSLKNIGHFYMAGLAAIINGYPAKKLKVIGVTGTDGKTTVVNLIYHLLKTAGKKVGMISTIGAKINNEELITTGLHTTTPDPFLLQNLLKRMVEKNCEYAVIEATSQALDQNRVCGCNFLAGVITNLTHEHLDYHGTMENYFLAKLKLFQNAKIGVINKDDNNLKQFLQDKQISRIKYQNKKLKIFTFGKRCADFTVKNLKTDLSRMSFTLKTQDKGELHLETELLGEYNLNNISAAVGIAKILGLNKNDIEKGVATFKTVIGRMEEVNTNQTFKVFIDFAHTPQAFEAILPTIRNLTDGKIIHVFGATGKRDKTKRPIMGEISGRRADYIILTTEDTYGEEPKGIIQSLEDGLKKAGRQKNLNYWIEPDRQQAINQAISMAKKKDIVIITGVGHQTSLNLGNKEISWSDYEAVKKALNHRK